MLTQEPSNDTAESRLGAFHLTLRDCMNNRVNIELFFVCWMDCQHNAQYIIGVKEEQDNVANLGLPRFKKVSRRRSSSSSKGGRPQDEGPVLRWPSACNRSGSSSGSLHEVPDARASHEGTLLNDAGSSHRSSSPGGSS